LKRGHYLVIGGAAAFVIGIAVVAAWALPLAEQIQKEAVLTQQEQLNAGESRTLSLDLTDTSKPLSIFISSTDATMPITIVVTSPEGKKLLDSNVTGNRVMSTDPTMAGTYVLRITNAGQAATSINAVFGRFPGIGENNQVNFEAFSGVLAGVGIIITGIIVMIAGVAITIIDSRKRPPPI
jgi:hypothetical protein